MSPKPAPAETILGQANQGPVAYMEHGEKGIRASLKAQRARAKKPSSFNEAVSNKMDENLAELEAETRLQAPNDLVISSGEAVRPDFRHSHFLDTLENPNMISVIASEHRLDLAACVDSRVAESAVDAAQSAQAAKSLEKMVCHQMAAAIAWL